MYYKITNERRTKPIKMPHRVKDGANRFSWLEQIRQKVKIVSIWCFVF